MAFALLDHTEEKTTIDEILTGTFREKDRQINFAINELEKIRQEIENDQEQMANEKDWGRYYGMGWSIRIIDNHITELKGEQE